MVQQFVRQQHKKNVLLSLQYPMTQQKSKIIKPGYINNIAIKATNVIANKDIENHATHEKRRCLFKHEKTLKFHNYYSERNCMLECKVEFALKMMNQTDPCVPWYFPSRYKQIIIFRKIILGFV